MKQYLFANCYSTIHGLNLIKYINNTYTHTFRVLQLEESLKLALLCYLVTSTRGRSQAETLLSLLHTDQFISSVRLWRIVRLLALSWAVRRSYRFLRMAEGIPVADWLLAWCHWGNPSCDWRLPGSFVTWWPLKFFSSFHVVSGFQGFFRSFTKYW